MEQEQKEKKGLSDYRSACFTSLMGLPGNLLEARTPTPPGDAIQRDESPLQRLSIFRSTAHFSRPLTGIRRIARTEVHQVHCYGLFGNSPLTPPPPSLHYSPGWDETDPVTECKMRHLQKKKTKRTL